MNKAFLRLIVGTIDAITNAIEEQRYEPAMREVLSNVKSRLKDAKRLLVDFMEQ